MLKKRTIRLCLALSLALLSGPPAALCDEEKTTQPDSWEIRMKADTLFTFTVTEKRRDYLNQKAFQGIWEYLLSRSDYGSAAVNLCPFTVALFLEPGTEPVSLKTLDREMRPDRRVINWWETPPPAPGPHLRVTLSPPPGARAPQRNEAGEKTAPNSGWNRQAMLRAGKELSKASGLPFEAGLAKDVYMRGWEDKGLVIFPVDFSFRPDPARLAEAWVWLDQYLRGAADPAPPPDSELAGNRPWRFMDTDWRYIPVPLPSHYRFDRMFWWSNTEDVFFQPVEMHPRCPFCNAKIDFDYAITSLTEVTDENLDSKSLDLTTPCCSRPTTVNELDFDGAFGVARFSIRFTGEADISGEALEELGRILRTRLKMMRTAR